MREIKEPNKKRKIDEDRKLKLRAVVDHNLSCQDEIGEVYPIEPYYHASNGRIKHLIKSYNKENKRHLKNVKRDLNDIGRRNVGDV